MSDLTWPADKMARFIDVTPRRLNQLVAEGVLTRESRGRYNPFVVTVQYVRYLRDRHVDEKQVTDAATRRSLKDTEGIGKLAAERRKLELECARIEGDLIPTGLVARLCEVYLARVRQCILSSSMTEQEKEDLLADLVKLGELDWKKEALRWLSSQ